ncbi:MAG: ABC transporter substrate binding protein, partial [Candidatus Tectomicrobia bacterium]
MAPGPVRCSPDIWVSYRKGVAIVGRTGKSVFRVTALILCVSLAGCVGLPVTPEEPPPASMPAPPPPPTPEIEPSRVVLFLSDDIPAYQAIATQIVERGDANEYKTVNLDGDPRISPANLAEIKAFDPDKIVSIALLAAQVGRQFADTPMVFCQVFNYRDHDLLSPYSRGVKLLPPFALQLEAWTELSPELESIGLVIGPNQEDLIAEAVRAAEAYKIELTSRIVSSDKEALYVFKRLTSSIQGFWLLPDNRILSPRVLKEMMSYGTAHGVQIVVFNSQLINL